jgi:hypothetical protein
VLGSSASVNLGAIAKVNPFYHMCEHLTGALREYSPRWQQALGTTPQDAFATLYADPVRLREFAELMNAISVPQGRLIAEAFDFAPYRCIMDVAGGPEASRIEIGLAHAHLRGIVIGHGAGVRRGPRADGGQGTVRPLHGDRRRLDNGPYPSGADVILLGHIPPRLE